MSPAGVTAVAELAPFPNQIFPSFKAGKLAVAIVVDPEVTRPYASVTTETYEPAVPSGAKPRYPDEERVASPENTTGAAAFVPSPTQTLVADNPGRSPTTSVPPAVTRPASSVNTLA